MAVLIPAIVDIAGKIFDKVIPDENARAQAKADFLKAAQDQDFQLMLAQIKTNEAEASSTNWFVAGWRPFIGWTCGVAFAYSYVLLPILQFLLYAFGTAAMVAQVKQLPALDLAAMIPVLFGMLGLGTMRTYEKKTGSEGNR